MTESKASSDSLTLAKLASGIAFDPLPGRCETCKWWDWQADAQAFRYCACLSPRICNALYPIDGAATTDELYPVIAGPKFGCIHYEAKPGKDRE